MSRVTDYLTDHDVSFQVLPHRRALTSIREARALGVAADEVVVIAAGTETESVTAPVAELFRDEGIQVACLTGEHDPNASEPVAELEGAR